jgi:hypothetical protein
LENKINYLNNKLVRAEEFINYQTIELSQKEVYIQTEFIKKEKELEEMRIGLISQFEKEQQEWKDIQKQFLNGNENDSPQETAVNLRVLFLHHLSQFYNVKKEKKEVEYKFQSVLHALFHNQEEIFETFFGFD